LSLNVVKKKGKPKNINNLVTAVLLLVGGGLIGIGGNPASDMPNGSKEMVLFGFVLSIIGIIVLTLKIKLENKIYYLIPLSIIAGLIVMCINTINNWDVQPTSSSSTSNGCYPSKPYYVCEYEKRSDGSTYKRCRCQPTMN
jgi:hypothetical protein